MQKTDIDELQEQANIFINMALRMCEAETFKNPKEHQSRIVALCAALLLAKTSITTFISILKSM